MNGRKPEFAIIGCGRVGTALAVNLMGAGYAMAGFSCATPGGLKRAQAVTCCPNSSLNPSEVSAADLVFITTPDTAIEGVCSEIASQRGFKENSVVLHCSGALSSTILAAARKARAHTGSMHPLQSFASGEGDGNPFQGIVMSSEGDAEALDACRAVACDLGGRFIRIRTESKILYHAAAVAASNYLVTLMGLSLGLMEEAGVGAKDAANVLQPLMEGTLSNIKACGVTGALTGPVARGDMEIVRRHIESMQACGFDLVELYKVLGTHTVKIAERQGLGQPVVNGFLDLFSS